MNIHDNLTRRQLLASTAASALALSPTFSQAQAAWPTKPLRLVVPFAPGGSSEIVARALAGEMGKTIGQSVFVDNKPGGAGNIAMQEVANATDDHTLILGHIGTLAVNPYIFPKLSYDANKDFTPITLISKVPSLYVVHPDLPVKNLKEFVAYAKANPGKLNYGSAGNGSAGHLAAEMFKRDAGIFVVHIPYNGGNPAQLALLSGQVDFNFDNLATAAANIKAGKLKALAVTTLQRSPALPNIPAMSETIKGFEVDTWWGLVAPAATPPAMVARLHQAFAAALGATETKTRFGMLMAEPVVSSPDEFSAFMKRELVKYESVVKATGARVD